MLKASISLAFLLSSFLCFSSGEKTGYDYYIIFVGEFANDKISLTINNKPIIANYRLENIDPSKKGNLSITQNADYITIAYNGNEIKRSRITVDFSLSLDISVNGKKKAFNINLKKGKVILVDYTPETEESTKVLSVEQVQEPVILM